MEIQEFGIVEYTGRAFSQDAQEAMGGKIERAIAELVTNCDDSYVRLERPDGAPVKGSILIEMEHRRKRKWKVVVRDRAEGMSAGEMKDKLTVLGHRTSGFASGQNVRGLLGRGGKDVAAFGTVTWESIKDGRYYGLRLQPIGEWQLFRPKKATPGLRRRLGVARGNGTVVTVDVDKTHSCPQHRTLYDRLPRYYGLRDIMSDPNRKVMLVNLNDGDHKGDRLLYSYPQGELKIDEDMPVPGYPDVTAHLQIWRHATRFNEPKRSPYRENGILVKSRRAIHQITLFGLESESYAEWFFGRLHCPHIDTLINEYDERFAKGQPHPDSNPGRLISRRREGLAPDHPFTEALFVAARERLETLVKEEKEADEERHRRIENEATRARLNKLANAARRFMVDKMREFDEELSLSGVVSSGLLIPDLTIIPGGCRVSPGETKTLSVLSRADLAAERLVTVSLESESTGVGLLATRIVLAPDEKIENALRGTFKVQALAEEGRGTILARRDGVEAQAKIEVTDEAVEVVTPEHLAFERERYSVVHGKRRAIRILAPISLPAEQGLIVHVTSTNPEIVVRRHKVRFKVRPDRGYAVATTQIEGRQLDARGTLHATVGSAMAAAAVRVVQKRLTGPPIDFKVVNEDFGPQRAIWSPPPDGYLLKIAGRHRSVGRYLGSSQEGFPGQESPHFRVLLAEIIAGSVAQRLLIEKGKKCGRDPDLDRVGFYAEHLRLTGQFLPIAHKAMLSSQEVKALRGR